MQDVLNWLLPLIGSAIITAVIGFLVKHYLTKYFEKLEAERKDKEEKAARLKELEEKEKAVELGKTIGKAVDKAVEPLAQKINEIDKKMEIDRKATITVMRSKMKTLRDQYKKQGYADAGDKATWEELYNDYANMGGNFFREWVNQWKLEVENLPLEPNEHENN